MLHCPPHPQVHLLALCQGQDSRENTDTELLQHGLGLCGLCAVLGPCVGQQLSLHCDAGCHGGDVGCDAAVVVV